MDDIQQTMVMDDGESDDEDKTQNSSIINQDTPRILAYLVRIDSSGRPTASYPLTKARTTIGRRESRDIRLIDPTVSGEHAEIEIDVGRGMSFVVDMGSTNKSRIGRQLPTRDNRNNALHPNRQCIVESKEYVTFGDVHFMFYYESDWHEVQEQMQSQQTQHSAASNTLITPPKPRRNVLAQTQSFVDEDTKSNTKANRTSKSDINLDMSLTPDDIANQISPSKVRFASKDEVKDIELGDTNDNSNDNSNENPLDDPTGNLRDNPMNIPNGTNPGTNPNNMDATLVWEEEEDEDATQSSTTALPATMAFDDEPQDGDQEQNYNGDLPATMAFGDDHDVENVEDINDPNSSTNVLPATMAFEDDEPQQIQQNGEDHSKTDANEDLPATMAFGDDNEADDGDVGDNIGDGEDLADTMAFDDEPSDEANVEVETNQKNDDLQATVAFDDDDDELQFQSRGNDLNSSDVGLPATVAIDDETQELDEEKEELQATVPMDDDAEAELPATMAIEDEEEASNPANGYELYGDFPETVPFDDGNEEQAELPATMVMDEEPKDEPTKPQEQYEQFPATIPMDGDNDAVELPATVPMDDDVPDEAPQGYGEFPATIPMDDANEEEPDKLPATVAIDDQNDLPATVAIDSSDGEESEALAGVGVGDTELPATVAIEDGPEDEIINNDNNQNEKQEPVISEALAATMPIDDDVTEDESLSQCTQMSSPSRNPSARQMDVDPKAVDDDEDTLLQSEKPELDATLAMSDEEEIEKQQTEATLPLTVEDIDLNTTASTARTNSNQSNDSRLQATVPIVDDNADVVSTEPEPEDEDEPQAASIVESAPLPPPAEPEQESEPEPQDQPVAQLVLDVKHPLSKSGTVIIKSNKPLKRKRKISKESTDESESDTESANPPPRRRSSRIAQKSEEPVAKMEPKKRKAVNGANKPLKRKRKISEQSSDSSDDSDDLSVQNPPKRRRSTRIAQKSQDDDGDIEMTTKARPKRQVVRRTAKKSIGRRSARIKKMSDTDPEQSDGGKGKRNARGRKRTAQERDAEDSDAPTNAVSTRVTRSKAKAPKKSIASKKKEEIKPPPAKRARRGRAAKVSDLSSETEGESPAPNPLRRSSRNKTAAASKTKVVPMKKKASPNRRSLKKKVASRRSKRVATSSDSEDEAANVQKRVVLLRTGTDHPGEKEKLEALGAVVLKEYDDSVTHLCSSEPRRTLKFIAGMATAKYIVTDKWTSDCVKRKTLNVDETAYFPNNGNTKKFERQYGFKLVQSLQRLRERETPLFDGYKVYFTKDQKPEVRNAIGTMAASHGAAIMGRIPRKTASGEIDEDIIVIGGKSTSKECQRVEKKGYDIYNRDIIITSILRQQIDFDDAAFLLED